MKLKLPPALAAMLLAAVPVTYAADLPADTTVNANELPGEGLNATGGTIQWIEGDTTNIFDYLPQITGTGVILDVGANDVSLSGSGGGFGSASMDITKTGAGILDFASHLGSSANWTVAEGTLSLTTGGNYGTIKGTATIKDGGTLLFAAHDCNGWGDNGLRTITVETGGQLSVANTNSNITFDTTVILLGGKFTGETGSKMNYNGGLIIADGSADSIMDIDTFELRNADNTFEVREGSSLTINTKLTNYGSEVNGLTKTGTGTLYITNAANNYSGGTFVNEGTLQVQGYNNSYGTIRGPLTIAEGAKVIFYGENAIGYNGNGETVNEININGGELLMDGVDSSAVKKQTFRNGTITITNGGSMTKANGGFVEIWDSSIVVKDSDATVTIDPSLRFRGTTVTFDVENGVADVDLAITHIGNGYSPVGTLVKTGSGTAHILSGNINSDIEVNGGELRLTSDGYGSGVSTKNITVAGGATLTTVSGDVFGWDGNSTKNLNLLEGGTLNIANTGASGLTLGANGQGFVINMESGSMITGDGAANLFNSKFVVTNTNGAAAIINTASLQFRAQGTDVVFDVTAYSGATDEFAPDLILETGLTNYGTNTYSFVKDGNGTMVLAGNNGYTAETVINAGALVVGNGGSTGTLGTKDVTVASGAKLAFNRSDTAYTVTNTISGGGSVHQIGTGTTTLGNANAYTGGTVISSGVLVASHEDALGTGGITLDGGELRFTTDNLNVQGGITITSGSLYLNSGIEGGITGYSATSPNTVNVTSGDFIMTGGDLYVNFATGGVYDVITGNASGTVSLSNCVIHLVNFSGSDYEESGQTFTLFTGFGDIIYGSNVSIVGLDEGWGAVINSQGELVFSQIPEPSAAGLLGFALLGGLLRRKRTA